MHSVKRHCVAKCQISWSGMDGVHGSRQSTMAWKCLHYWCHNTICVVVMLNQQLLDCAAFISLNDHSVLFLFLISILLLMMLKCCVFWDLVLRQEVMYRP